METDPFKLVNHCLGHTQTGKLIMEFTGTINQFRVAHLKWNSTEHYEAYRILSKLQTKKEKQGDFGDVSLALLAERHYEEYAYKKNIKSYSVGSILKSK